ncbi:hypothetical protein [Nonomuraea sp. NPDC050643]|uniref:hypothetical protein n=1 Tax=Nonomuraea sp. NPDC050643 TaxID=3155660 RepID=UPI003408B81A
MRLFRNLAIVIVSAAAFAWLAATATATATAGDVGGAAPVGVAAPAVDAGFAGPYSTLPSCREHQQVYRNWGLKVEGPCLWGSQIVGGQIVEGWFFWWSRY